MLRLTDTIIGFLAPHECLACGREGALLCVFCLPLLPDTRPQCYRCNRSVAGVQTCPPCRQQSALSYVWVRTPYEAFGEALVRRLKFGRTVAAAQVMAAAMAAQLPADIPLSTAVVPVPTATSRVRQRGYDQATLLARGMADYTGLPLRPALLRYGQQRQTGSSRRQRLAQLEAALEVRPTKLKDVEHVLLVDDVVTTGATLETAARVLKQAGVRSVAALAFARAE